MSGGADYHPLINHVIAENLLCCLSGILNHQQFLRLRSVHPVWSFLIHQKYDGRKHAWFLVFEQLSMLQTKEEKAHFSKQTFYGNTTIVFCSTKGCFVYIERENNTLFFCIVSIFDYSVGIRRRLQIDLTVSSIFLVSKIFKVPSVFINQTAQCFIHVSLSEGGNLINFTDLNDLVETKTQKWGWNDKNFYQHMVNNEPKITKSNDFQYIRQFFELSNHHPKFYDIVFNDETAVSHFFWEDDKVIYRSFFCKKSTELPKVGLIKYILNLESESIVTVIGHSFLLTKSSTHLFCYELSSNDPSIQLKFSIRCNQNFWYCGSKQISNVVFLVLIGSSNDDASWYGWKNNFDYYVIDVERNNWNKNKLDVLDSLISNSDVVIKNSKIAHLYKIQAYMFNDSSANFDNQSALIYLVEIDLVKLQLNLISSKLTIKDFLKYFEFTCLLNSKNSSSNIC